MRSPLLFALLVSLSFAYPGCGGPTNPSGTGDGGIDLGAMDGGSGDSSTDVGAGPDAFGSRDMGAANDAGVDAAMRVPCTASGACNPFDSTSCPGQACRPSPAGTVCAALSAAPVAEHGACSADADCMPGLVCLDFGDGLGFTCDRMCADGSTGACGPGDACTGTFGDVCIRACRPTPVPCSIYDQDCTNAADTCTFVRNPETSMPYTGCRPAGMQGEGAACGGAAGTCGHGLVCVGGVGMNVCRQPCDPDVMPALCPAMEVCTGFARTWMVGFCQPAP